MASSGDKGAVPGLPACEFTFESYWKGDSIEADLDPQSTGYDSQSLSESIATFQEENGRTYHSYRAGSYHFPNDPSEAERYDEQHAIIRMLMDDRNYFAPLSKDPNHCPKHILDIATGTGIWAIEMGDEFPDSEVTGTDLSPIQSELVPPNVRFFVEDSSEEWDYTQKYDYIHTRITIGCWSDFRTQIIAQAFANLSPGGYFEAQELYGPPACDDGTLSPTSPIVRWTEEINAASEAAERDIRFAPKIKEWLVEAGFVDVQERVIKIPMNGWPKEMHLKHIGLLWQRNLLNGLSAFSLGLLSRVRGLNQKEIELRLVDVRKALFDQGIHAYQRLYVVWGRKPGEGEET